ncbi:polysaccharide biosynthesis protein GtrA [Mesobacillus campisalis]|uniref:Polysaccharide biosynthesis protein GtrA n=1 Tax=Mesobacillus campisalis TaxID=1408103 RepID=A0A0M2T105_9BACI|nr:GtrA family protein [Mesobacillus campisalis]KKK38505.1 polysaccharide biosynthesis protein GtrA [Mesobacillus campisalis]
MSTANILKPTDTFLRFLLVGIINTVIGLSSMFLLLNFAGFSYWLATFAGNSIGAGTSFFMNRAFTFKSHISIGAGIPKFIAVILMCYVISYSLGGLAANTLPLPGWAAVFITKEELAVFLGTGFYTISNYLGQKLFVF